MSAPPSREQIASCSSGVGLFPGWVGAGRALAASPLLGPGDGPLLAGGASAGAESGRKRGWMVMRMVLRVGVTPGVAPNSDYASPALKAFPRRPSWPDFLETRVADPEPSKHYFAARCRKPRWQDFQMRVSDEHHGCGIYLICGSKESTTAHRPSMPATRSRSQTKRALGLKRANLRVILRKRQKCGYCESF